MCDAAEAVRESNLSIVDLLNQPEPWAERRVIVEATLDDLHAALAMAADHANDPLRESLLIWREDTGVLRDRVAESESPEGWLYDPADREGPNVVNPALDRIDDGLRQGVWVRSATLTPRSGAEGRQSQGGAGITSGWEAGRVTDHAALDPTRVQSRSDLVQFLRDLRTDLVQNPEGWAHLSLEEFLESTEAWVSDAKPAWLDEGTRWEQLALVLSVGRYYE